MVVCLFLAILKHRLGAVRALDLDKFGVLPEDYKRNRENTGN